MAAFAEIKHEWRLLKHDRPGQRFRHHRERMSDSPKWKKIARAAAGFALIAIGIVFCILPGPGTLGIVLGLALLAGMSKSIARLLDRIEPRVRHGLARAQRFWHELPRAKKAILIVTATIVVALGAVVVWRGWVGPIVASHLG